MTTQTISSGHEHQILRFRVGPRIVHAMLATSFILLLGTGYILFWPLMSQYAAGGLSLWLHRVGAIIYMAIPLVYLIVDRQAAKELLWDSFHYDRDDVQWLLHFFRYFFGHADGMPPQGRLNAGQKLHHAGVVLFSAFIVASGLVLWIGKGALGANALALAAMTHDIAMFVLTVLLVGHLYFTFVYNALSGMVTGYVEEEDAQLEHSKWVAELEEDKH
ncbi:MAG: cytochrome b/b6 domain-containing protein [Caldilineaceae bacterium]|nr:cytochrome b/b6 domain-containing protein [Caldilineaceae bacterium]